jgi:hypothetical protein
MDCFFHDDGEMTIKSAGMIFIGIKITKSQTQFPLPPGFLKFFPAMRLAQNRIGNVQENRPQPGCWNLIISKADANLLFNSYARFSSKGSSFSPEGCLLLALSIHINLGAGSKNSNNFF